MVNSDPRRHSSRHPADRSLIDGQETFVDSSTRNNLGTARIYGGSLDANHPATDQSIDNRNAHYSYTRTLFEDRLVESGPAKTRSGFGRDQAQGKGQQDGAEQLL